MKSKLFGRALSLIVCAAIIASMFVMSFSASADIIEDGDTTTYSWDFTDSDFGQMNADEMDENSIKFDKVGGALSTCYGYNEELGAYEVDTTPGVTDQTRGLAITNPYNTIGKSFTLVGGALADYKDQYLHPGVVFASDENGYYCMIAKVSNFGVFQKIVHYYSFKDGTFKNVNATANGGIETMYISEVDGIPTELGDDKRFNIGYLTGLQVHQNNFVFNAFTWQYDVVVEEGDINITVTAMYDDGEFQYEFTSDVYTFNLDVLMGYKNIGSVMEKYESHYRFAPHFGFYSQPYQKRDAYSSDSGAPDQSNQATQIYSIYAEYEDAGDNCTHPLDAVEIDGVAEPTCTEDGYTGDETCAECGEILKEGSVISALGHSWKETERVDATIEEPGYYTHICTVCEFEETVVLEPLEAYTVTFLGEGGDVLDEQIVGYGLAATAPASPESALGFEFIGWDTVFNKVTSDLTVTAVFYDPDEYAEGYVFDFNLLDTSAADAVKLEYLSKAGNTIGYYDNENGGYIVTPKNNAQYFAAVQNPLHTGLVSSTLDGNGNSPGIVFAQDESGYYVYRVTYDKMSFRRSVIYLKKNGSSFTQQSLLLNKGDSSFNPVLATVVAINDQELATPTQFFYLAQKSIDYPGLGTSSGITADIMQYFTTSYVTMVEDGVITIDVTITYDDGETQHTYTLETQTFSLEFFTDETADYNNKAYLNDLATVSHDSFVYVTGYVTTSNAVSGYTNDTRILSMSAEFAEYSSDECIHDERDWLVEDKTFDCETGGMSGNTVCGYCGETIKESEELAPVGRHTWKLVSEVEGTKNYECSVCGATKQEVACTHTETETKNDKAATCTTAGYTGDKVCSACGVTVTAGSSIPALGHDETTETTKEANCTETGSQVTTCGRCDYTATVEIPALGHDETVTVTKEATCTEKGTQTVTCSRCDYTATEDIETIPHDYVADGAQSVAPTCEEAGKTVSVCSVCSDSKEEEVAALGHDTTTATTKEPTCTEAGVSTTTCSRCDYTAEAEIPALGHTPSDWITDVEPTKDAEGSAHIECTVCHETLETKVLDKLPAGVSGDVTGDGVVNTGDAVLIARHSAKIITLSDEAQAMGDVTGDGILNTGDAVLVARYAAKIITSFPVDNK